MISLALGITVPQSLLVTGVKRFQTVHGSGVNVTRGLVLLSGINTEALVWGFFSQEV